MTTVKKILKIISHGRMTKSITVIEQRMVKVDGKLIDHNVGVNDGNYIQIGAKTGIYTPTKQNTRIWLYNKPQGLICTRADPECRKTIFEMLPALGLRIPHVLAIGRLDFLSEGLMILTNDGDLKRALELPSSKIERSYKVRVFGRMFNEEKLAMLRQGFTITSGGNKNRKEPNKNSPKRTKSFGPYIVEIIRRQNTNTWLHMKLFEGKNNEIRRAMRKFSLRVNRLIRTSYGPYTIKMVPNPNDLVEVKMTRELKTLMYKYYREKASTSQTLLNKQKAEHISIENRKQEEIDEDEEDSDFLIEEDSKFGNTSSSQPSEQMDKKSKQELVNKMKDQVPVVLLNQWLGINPEKSHFARGECCLANSDEYSVYSSESMSQALSIKGKAFNKSAVKQTCKRNSLLVTENNMSAALEKLGVNLSRRMTIFNKDMNLEDIIKNCHPAIKEVDDLSSSDTPRSISRQSKQLDKEKKQNGDEGSDDESEDEVNEVKKDHDSNNRYNSSTGDDSNENMEIEVHLLDSNRDIPTIENNLCSFQENNFSSSQATSQVKTDTLQNNLLPKEGLKATDLKQKDFIIRKTRSITANKNLRTPNQSKKRTMKSKITLKTNELQKRKSSGNTLTSPFLFQMSCQSSIHQKLTTPLTPLKSSLKFTHKQSSIPRIQKPTQLLINGKGLSRCSIPSLQPMLSSKFAKFSTAIENIEIKEHFLSVSQATGLKFLTPKISKRNLDKFQTSFKKAFYPIQVSGSKIMKGRY